MTDRYVNVIGAGLAGCEAAWQLAIRGIPVRLYEMKPGKKSPAHSYDGLAELVCSNSLRAADLTNAAGLLKEEMRRLNSLVMAAADASSVPAGGALAVNRYAFSDFITKSIKKNANIELISKEAETIPEDGITVVATGPLTSGALFACIDNLTGGNSLHFFDAAAPIVTAQSVDLENTFSASRYGKGEGDYINCPMDAGQYNTFVSELVRAECAPLHAFEDSDVFEGCMPVETMAKRGMDTLRFGPLKPVGLKDPETGKRPYAVVQLRHEDRDGRLFNIVGFQTRLKFPEQRRVFGLIPALKNAEFVRYGVMHRNTYLNSPKLLNGRFQLREKPSLYFAGQITGVEGYVESAASGLLCGIYAACDVLEKRYPEFDDRTALGALSFVAKTLTDNFQPMNINFGIMAPNDVIIKDRKASRLALSQRALEAIDELKKTNDILEVANV